MRCDNCRDGCRPAFTLAAYPADEGDAVLVDFCSIDCLQAWTSEGEGDLAGWNWGPSGDGAEPARPEVSQ